MTTTINSIEAKNLIKQAFTEFIDKLEKVSLHSNKISPEGKYILNFLPELQGGKNRNFFQEELFDELNDQGLEELFRTAALLAKVHNLSIYTAMKDRQIRAESQFRIVSDATSFTPEVCAPIEVGRTVVYRVEQKIPSIMSADSYFTIEWRVENDPESQTGKVYNALNNRVTEILNVVDNNPWDRKLHAKVTGTHTIYADIFLKNKSGKTFIETVRYIQEVYPVDPEIKNLPYHEKIIMAIQYSDWSEELEDLRGFAISIAACAAIIGILMQFTKTAKLVEILSPILIKLGLLTGVVEIIRGIVLMGDFLQRTASAGSKEALYDAGQVFSQAVYKIGIGTLITLVSYFAGKKTIEDLKVTSNQSARRIFSSSDKYVGETANAIEANFPGRVVDVNKKIFRPDGTTLTDFDIELNNIVIQVKSGTGKKLTNQMIKTATGTTKMVIGYTPDLNPSAALVRNARNAGFEVFTSLDDLLNFIANH